MTIPTFTIELFGFQFIFNSLAVGGIIFLLLVGLLIALVPRVWRSDEEKLRRKLRQQQQKKSSPPTNDPR